MYYTYVSLSTNIVLYISLNSDALHSCWSEELSGSTGIESDHRVCQLFRIMVYSYVYCCDIFECSSHFSHPLMHLPTPAPAHRIWYSGDLVSAWWASKPSIVKWRLICSQHLHFEGINLQMTYKYFTDLDTVAQALRLVTLQMLPQLQWSSTRTRQDNSLKGAWCGSSM